MGTQDLPIHGNNTHTSNSEMPLSMVDQDTNVVIKFINGGSNAVKRLTEMGLIPGEKIAVVRSIGHGPVIVLVKGSRMAIGHGLAMKVMVC